MCSIKFIQREIFQVTNHPFILLQNDQTLFSKEALRLPPLFDMAFRQQNGDAKVIPGSFRTLSVKNDQVKKSDWRIQIRPLHSLSY